MNNLVWHDEEHESWTYCEGFKITNYSLGSPYFELFRIYPTIQWRNHQIIGVFKSLKTAKYVAEVIKDAEQYGVHDENNR